MSILHVEFVSKRKQKFQELCRLAKYWTNGPEYMKNRFPYTSSWFIELIAANIFDIPKQNWNLIELFECFLKRVRHMRMDNSYIAFSDFYDKERYRAKWKNRFVVIDPTDPEDNLAERGYQYDNMDLLIKRASDTLKTWKDKNFDSVFQTYLSRQPS